MVGLAKTQVKLNKPLYLGSVILVKYICMSFGITKLKYGDKAKLSYIGTGRSS